MAEGSLLFRCLWKVGLPHQLKTENDLSSRDDMGCMELSSSSCAEIGVPIDLRQVSQGISVVAQKKSIHLSCMTGNGGLLWNEGRGIGHHLELIWATLNYFTFLRLHKSPSTLLRVFLGILWYSVKQIKAPYMFDWEQGIALHAMQGYQATYFSEQEV